MTCYMETRGQRTIVGAWRAVARLLREDGPEGEMFLDTERVTGANSPDGPPSVPTQRRP